MITITGINFDISNTSLVTVELAETACHIKYVGYISSTAYIVEKYNVLQTVIVKINIEIINYIYIIPWPQGIYAQARGQRHIYQANP